jgi:transcriptional regulator with XRE-family HTH domain
MARDLTGMGIRELRKQAGISLTELAKRAGVSKQAVSNWEVRGAIPSGDNLLKLAQALNVEPKALLAQSTSGGSLNAQEQALLEKFRTLSERERRVAVALLTALQSIK